MDGENIEMLKLQLELKKIESEERQKEREFEERKREFEERQKERELEERQKEREREERQKEREVELEKLRLEAEIELRTPRVHNEDNIQDLLVSGRDNNKIKEIDNFRKILKALVPRVPNDPGELPWFFQVVEGVFRSQDIPKEIQGHLISPLLEDKMQPLLINLSETQLKEYECIRDEILRLNKLTSAEYRKRFDEARKLRMETWPQYVQKLSSYWHFYVSSKKVDDLTKMNNLVVLDRFKKELSEGARSYINLHEADDLMSFEKAAQMAEIYESATERLNYDTRRNQNESYRSFEKSYKNCVKYQENKNIHDNQAKRSPISEMETKSGIECYNCGKKGHFAKHCRKVKTLEKKPQVKIQTMEVKTDTPPNDYAITARVGNEMFHTESNNSKLNPKLSELKTVKLIYRQQIINAVIDSGAQISVFQNKAIHEKDKTPKGNIYLQPAFGKSRKAELVEIKLSLFEDAEETVLPYIQAIVAICEDLNVDALIDSATYEALIRQKTKYIGLVDKETECSEENKFNKEKFQESVIKNPSDNFLLSTNNSDSLQHPADERNAFLRDQLACETLVEIWKKASIQKGNYIVKDQFLYHKGNIANDKILQLVVPLKRRKQILELAHKSVVGAHMGQKKTGDRIKLTFWWPSINEDVKHFCSNCRECQLKGREFVTDRIPISPVTRPDLPFLIVNIDIIGPISPVSAKGNSYILTLVDYCTRWAEAIPLRSITAKNTCNALLSIFMRLGIPNIITSDQGTNFTAELTKTFYSKIGISPRFSTPGHPESNGLVERWNGVLKNMLHHVIREDPKHWDLQIPFLLWAYREVPHSTTGVSPFVLMYGRNPSGPLSILKDIWMDDKPIPLCKGKSVGEYMEELKSRMDKAIKFAKLTSEYQQELMCHNYNTRSKEKCFNVGDEVIVLIPDSTNKLYARWKGPAKVVRKERPHTYVVSFEDGIEKRVHVNKLRLFKSQVNIVGIVFDTDHEFGDIEYVPWNEKKSIQNTNCEEQMTNLSVKQQNEIKQILSKYQEVFSGKVKKALVAEHHIRIRNDSVYRRPHIYRIPEAMKTKVDTQIQELLKEGLIEPRVSEYAHPIVCAAKKDGDMRLCIDYRALNAISETDAFPMENIKELMMVVAKAKYLSLLDLKKGYWQIPLAEDSKLKSAFVTHEGQYVWNVMPFGLKGASATFQRAMNEALFSHRSYSRAYIDDIAVFSQSWQDHIQHLQSVISTLDKLKLTINLEKCEFGKHEIKYLGHIVGSGQHRPDPEKLKVIESLEKPNTKPELRRILGLFNYYRDYIANFSILAYPLTEMTKKNGPNQINWTLDRIKAFEDLKEKLCQAVTCYAPDLAKPFLIYTDASNVGVGAILAQEDDTGRRPIAFASAKLSNTQQAWSVAEKEAYAVVWALKKFEVWTYGTKIEIITDNNPLKFLTMSSSPSPRLQRWALALQRYDVTVMHRKGSEHINADTLSRLH